MIKLTGKAVNDWALKEVLSREILGDDADDAGQAAQSRIQFEDLESYAEFALRQQLRKQRLYDTAISPHDVRVAARAIARIAFGIRESMQSGVQPCAGVTLPVPSAAQLAADRATEVLLAKDIDPDSEV